jgi:hypothetical protein
MRRDVDELRNGGPGPGTSDFRAFLRLKGWHHEVSASCLLYAFAADLLAGRPAEARVFNEQALARVDKGAWPYPLLQCLRGDLPAAAVITAAPGDPERTEARLCLCIQQITDGHRAAGLRDLRELCDHNQSSDLFAIDIARAVLRREEKKTTSTSKK